MNAIFLQQLANPEINFPLVLPEAIVALVATIVMLIDCFAPRQRFTTSALSIVGLIAAGVATV